MDSEEHVEKRIADALASGKLSPTRGIAELSDARSILESLNRAIAGWNEEVEEKHRLDLLDEIWLLTERQNVRGGHGSEKRIVREVGSEDR